MTGELTMARAELEGLADRSGGGTGDGLVDGDGRATELGALVGAAVRDPLLTVSVAVVDDEGFSTTDVWVGVGLTVVQAEGPGELPVWVGPAHSIGTAVIRIAGLTDLPGAEADPLDLPSPEAPGWELPSELASLVGITVDLDGSARRVTVGVDHAGGLLRFERAEDGSASGSPIDPLDLWAELSVLSAIVDEVHHRVVGGAGDREA